MTEVKKILGKIIKSTHIVYTETKPEIFYNQATVDEAAEELNTLIEAAKKEELQRVINWLDKHNMIAINKTKSLNELGWLITVEDRQALSKGGE